MEFKMKACALQLLVLGTAGLAYGQIAHAAQVAPTQDKTVEITILHTNDNHGHFWKNQHGEYGMAARKTLIDSIRKEVQAKHGYVLLFSGGDINTGVPESDMQDAKPDFMGMNALGYNAMAVGNHEFDNPLSVLMKQAHWANFPFLAANIYDKKTGKRIFQPYKIFNEGGVRIAVIGLTTEDTAKVGNPAYVKNIVFKNPIEEIKTLIPEIKKKDHPDLIFAITHMGHYHNAEHGVNAPGDVTLARSLPQGELNMIIGGHSQNPVCMNPDLKTYDKNFKPGAACRPDKQNGTWIVQAYEWGKYVGRADFKYKDGKFTLVNYQLIPVNMTEKKRIDGKEIYQVVGKTIPEDPQMLKILKPYQENGKKSLKIKIGEVHGLLLGDRDVVRFKQTNLGNFIATIQYKKVNADFGIKNSGGIRDSINSGAVTYKDILKVQPFGNTIAKATLTGADLIKYLDVVANMSVDSGAYPQFSSNISMIVTKKGVQDVKLNGKPIQAKATYTFALPYYNAVGGDGYPKLKNVVNTGLTYANVLKEYIQTHSPIDAEAFMPKNTVIFKNE
ncbi:bifunctional UDP-sugar hydrolase/5'-nucleotidase UshA [Actinobacillus delphinicola]|uniref:Bifunctional UDP-sugar hydrolase/5'-nucleotidase periplasmic n=1 Tax=Actinobacillus delphinicola TaxID=51161 RepID=A0A448TSK3_9PAST|nr:bifunctional UDP-sugar hydrolase/5'-nucleotidase UshA [Actinobacillus delphinicola]VEJ08972.1 bifunctional UDP-sugar hydrolase/5'-nucleotidase periplasmic [Actinobacillus delphinicola]